MSRARRNNGDAAAAGARSAVGGSAGRYSGSFEMPGSNFWCSRSASVRVSTIAVNTPATFCGRVFDGGLRRFLPAGLAATALLAAGLEFFRAAILRRFLLGARLLLSVVFLAAAFVAAFAVFLLRVFFAIAVPAFPQSVSLPE